MALITQWAGKAKPNLARLQNLQVNKALETPFFLLSYPEKNVFYGAVVPYFLLS